MSETDQQPAVDIEEGEISDDGLDTAPEHALITVESSNTDNNINSVLPSATVTFETESETKYRAEAVASPDSQAPSMPRVDIEDASVVAGKRRHHKSSKRKKKHHHHQQQQQQQGNRRRHSSVESDVDRANDSYAVVPSKKRKKKHARYVDHDRPPSDDFIADNRGFEGDEDNNHFDRPPSAYNRYSPPENYHEQYLQPYGSIGRPPIGALQQHQQQHQQSQSQMSSPPNADTDSDAVRRRMMLLPRRPGTQYPDDNEDLASPELREDDQYGDGNEGGDYFFNEGDDDVGDEDANGDNYAARQAFSQQQQQRSQSYHGQASGKRNRQRGSAGGRRGGGNGGHQAWQQPQPLQQQGIQQGGFDSDDKQNQAEKPRCKYYMEGRCGKSDSCPFSHDFKPPRKREVCKFYALSSCLKGEYCLYMHDDFPCKFYHMHNSCKMAASCKFSHDPLTKETKTILERFVVEQPFALNDEDKEDMEMQHSLAKPEQPQSLLGAPPPASSASQQQQQQPPQAQLSLMGQQLSVSDDTGGAASGRPQQPRPPNSTVLSGFTEGPPLTQAAPTPLFAQPQPQPQPAIGSFFAPNRMQYFRNVPPPTIPSGAMPPIGGFHPHRHQLHHLQQRPPLPLMPHFNQPPPPLPPLMQQPTTVSSAVGVANLSEDAALNAVASLLKDMIKGTATGGSKAGPEGFDNAARNNDTDDYDDYGRPVPRQASPTAAGLFRQQQQQQQKQQEAGSEVDLTGPAPYRPSLNPPEPPKELPQPPSSPPQQQQQQHQAPPPSLLSRQFSRPYKWKLVPIDALKKVPYPLMKLPIDLPHLANDPRLHGQLSAPLKSPEASAARNSQAPPPRLLTSQLSNSANEASASSPTHSQSSVPDLPEALKVYPSAGPTLASTASKASTKSAKLQLNERSAALDDVPAVPDVEGGSGAGGGNGVPSASGAADAIAAVAAAAAAAAVAASSRAMENRAYINDPRFRRKKRQQSAMASGE